MSKKGILFFAAQKDLYNSLKLIEHNNSIKYAEYNYSCQTI